MGPAVHFQLTREWAIEAGLADIAERVARADVGYDFQFPARAGLLNMTRHFAPFVHLWGLVYARRALRGRSPEYLGWALHCRQDAVAHGVLGLGHVRFMLGWARHPDDWDLAPERVRHRIRERSLALLRRYHARWSA